MAENTVTVEALEYHTYDGEEYQVGDTYDIDEQYVDSLRVQGKAVRVDRVKVAKKADADAKKTEADRAKAPKGTAVTPMAMAAPPAMKPGKVAKASAPKKPAKAKK